MHLDLQYTITGLGWAECSIKDQQSSCTVTASYLGDALGDLMLAACAGLRYFDRLGFSFAEEPGEYRWVLRAPRLNEIELKIYEFFESNSNKPDEEGKLLFSTTCPPLTFARAVHSGAAQVLALHGEAGYLEQWSEHPFPMFIFRELERLLVIEDRGGLTMTLDQKHDPIRLEKHTIAAQLLR